MTQLIQYYGETQKAMIDWMVAHPGLTAMCYAICGLFVVYSVMTLINNEEVKRIIRKIVDRVL